METELPVEMVVSFLNAKAPVPLTLLPIINPLSGTPVFAATADSHALVARKMARRAALNQIRA